MQELIIIVHVLAAIGIVGLVLLQHGKGADVGAAFGSGSANSMLGSAGAVPFLMKITAILAAIFFATSLSLGYLVTQKRSPSSLMKLPTTNPSTQPYIPVTPTDQSSTQSPTTNQANTPEPENKTQPKQSN